MTKKQVVHIILFCLLCIGLDQVIGRVIHWGANAYVYDHRLGDLLEQKQQPQVLILGSSRALNNYDPATLTDQLGKTAFNMGVSGTSVAFHADLLEVLVANQVVPETLIYNLDDSSSLFKTEGVIYRTEEFYPYVDNEAVNKVVCAHRKKSYIATQVSQSFRNNVNFSNALNYMAFGRQEANFEMTNVDELGANLMEGKALASDIKAKETLVDTSRVSDDYIDRMKRLIELCKEHHIDLIMVNPPSKTVHATNFVELVATHFPNTRIIDLYDAKIPNSGFYNRSHLNKTGAILFTQHLTQILTQ
jgi:hypothetical protein